MQFTVREEYTDATPRQMTVAATETLLSVADRVRVSFSASRRVTVRVPATGVTFTMLPGEQSPVLDGTMGIYATKTADDLLVTANLQEATYSTVQPNPLSLPSAFGYGATLRASIRAYKRGLRTRPILIGGIGDSNLSAQGAGDGTGTVGYYTKAFGKGPIEQIAKVSPTLAGLPLRNTSWFGDGNANIASTPVMQYNPNMSLGTGWNRTGFGGALFGMFIAADAAAAGDFVYNFGAPLTDVEIYAVVGASNSNSVRVYNSADVLIGTINTNGANAATKFLVTGSFPDGIVKLRQNDGARTFYMCGMVAWNSAEKSIVLVRNSYAGALTANFTTATNSWDGMSFYPSLRLDAAFVVLTINDIGAATARATYNTNLSYILDAVAKYGDPIVSSGGNGNTANYGNGTAEGIEAEAKIVAAKYGAMFVSMHKEWVSWAATNALGYEYDGLHRTELGYLDQAKVYANILRAMVAPLSVPA